MKNGSLLLVGGTIYVSPEEKPIPEGVLLIQDGKIAAVESGEQLRVFQADQTLDCAGLTITSGFWNSHVHFFERKWANVASIPAPELGQQLQDTFLQYGFTNVFDLSSLWENTRQLRDRVESGDVMGPGIQSTGEGLVPPGGVPPDPVLNLMGLMKTPLPEIADAYQALAICSKLLDEGVDGIKLFMKNATPAIPPFPETVIEAIVTEAHHRRKPVFVHPNSGADVLAAIRGGVDVIAHTTPGSGPWDEVTVAAIKGSAAALTPTLSLWKHYLRHDRLSAQQKSINTAMGQLRNWIDAGGTVLFGTDLGATEYDPGDEYRLMSKAGMNFQQVLASLTTAPAERFAGSKLLASIVTGSPADLVVLKGDPGKDIRALTAVQYTLRAGELIYRAVP